jgi:hypothetical protein
MPLKQLDAPCWAITFPDGTPVAQWEEEHFSGEDEWPCPTYLAISAELTKGGDRR